MIVVADTSGIIASVDRSCPEHKAARRIMDTAGLLVSSAEEYWTPERMENAEPAPMPEDD